MGKARISCCGYVFIIENTKGGESGIGRCPKCGCSYGWADIGGGEVKTWTEKSCPQHGADAGKVALCERCHGTGRYVDHNWDAHVCPACGGVGLQRV